MGTFINNVPVLVTHYTPLQERKALMDRQLLDTGFHHRFYVEDFDREVLDNEILRRHYCADEGQWHSRISAIANLVQENNQFRDAKRSWQEDVIYENNFQIPFRELSMAEISLAIKHVEALRIIVESGWNYAIIIEDDVMFLEDFSARFFTNFLQTPPSWDLIFFGAGCGFKVPERQAERRIYRMEPPRGKCSDSYCVSHKAAKRLLDSILPFCLPIDFELVHWMNVHSLETYWWEPWLCVQGSQTGMVQSAIR